MNNTHKAAKLEASFSLPPQPRGPRVARGGGGMGEVVGRRLKQSGLKLVVRVLNVQ